MKYFENLPKTQFESTIGNFTISSFFTYIDIDSITLNRDDVTVDSKTTLLEASYNVYEDPNSFWIFLISNKAINPFNLLSQNVTLFKTANEGKINFFASDKEFEIRGVAYPKGTIVLPWAANTGPSDSWSSVGNFDLYGSLALLESTSFYDGSMIIKDQVGGFPFLNLNGITGDRLTVVYPSGTGYAVFDEVYVVEKEDALEKVVEIKKPEDGKTEIKTKYSSSKTPDQIKGDRTPVVPTETVEITATQFLEDKNKKIKAITPSEVGLLLANFITVKYS